jgi:hypothetical protein
MANPSTACCIRSVHVSPCEPLPRGKIPYQGLRLRVGGLPRLFWFDDRQPQDGREMLLIKTGNLAAVL